MSLPDRDALEDIRTVAAANPVVMFAGTDDPAFAREAIAAGVCSYNLSGVAYADMCSRSWPRPSRCSSATAMSRPNWRPRAPFWKSGG